MTISVVVKSVDLITHLTRPGRKENLIYAFRSCVPSGRPDRVTSILKKSYSTWSTTSPKVNDKDFGELIFLQGRLSYGTILFRVKGQKSQEKVKLMKKVLMGHRDAILNHYIVITKAKIRIIPLGDTR
jgi:hypothetical protein